MFIWLDIFPKFHLNIFNGFRVTIFYIWDRQTENTYHTHRTLLWWLHTEKSFRNLIKSTRNQIVFTIFRLIWTQTDIRLDPNQSKPIITCTILRLILIQTGFHLDQNQSENDKYNMISGWFKKILKRFFCVHRWDDVRVDAEPGMWSNGRALLA